MRIIFLPMHEPLPLKPDGGLNWLKITAILILAVEDYH